MPTTVPEVVNRQLVKYEESAKAIASRQHFDLQELHRATKYAGRNIERLHNGVSEGFSAVAAQEAKIVNRLDDLNEGVDNLTNVTKLGFGVTFAFLGQISDQLGSILQALRYPSTMKALEQRERGIYLAGKGKKKLAVRALQRAIEHNESDYVALYSLAYLFAGNEQFEAAAGLFDDSALYADANPTLSAEAAIMAAHCYDKIGETNKAWTVLRRALARNCPDVALTLMQHASDEADVELATKAMADAFVIDAELVVAAEIMELPNIDSAANIAYGQFAKQLSSLKKAWQQLDQVAAKAGVAHNHPLPKRNIPGKSPQTLLIYAAVYRRTLQNIVTELKDELAGRVWSPQPLPKLPWSPLWNKDSLDFSIIFTITLSLIGLSFIFQPLVVMRFLSIGFFIAAGAIARPEIRRAREYSREKRQYKLDYAKAERAISRAQAANDRIVASQAAILKVVASVEDVLDSTLPPVVPRAFSGNLIDYTQR
jgi:tetratricopeptide (TPR) repeat protein